MEKLNFHKEYFRYAVLNANNQVLAITLLSETARDLVKRLHEDGIAARLEVMSNVFKD